MNIYFSASISLDRSALPRYQQIVEFLKKGRHKILSEQVIDPTLQPGEGLPAEELWRRETAKVEKADVLIAEVSAPSWGTAFLMEHALKHQVPVVALFYKETTHQLPLMIQGHPDFYVAHYSEENMAAVLKHNLKFFEKKQREVGKLVVIDGADGSGKATQTQLLIEYCTKHHLKNKYISFPRYYTTFHGRHVGRFLTGEFGGNTQVSPYLSSLAFALDRLTAKGEIEEWLEEGNVVIADRYVSASMAHQASKLPKKDRDDFIKWIYEMEYKEHKLPREEVVLFLHVPIEYTAKLIAEKAGRKYVKGQDEAEKDLKHQAESIEMYRYLATKFTHWQVIECVENDKLLSREAIHRKIVKALQEKAVLR